MGACIAFVSPGALAQSNDAVTAEALFQEGRDLLDQRRYAEACPKLVESHRLDPATGTLVALGMCFEGEGKLASAWSTFTDAAARAEREGNPERETLATERAAALRARVSKLTIQVSGAIAVLPGLEIRRDGVALGRGAWNIAVPIDGGAYTIEALAPERQPWRTTATVKGEADAVIVVVQAPIEIAKAAPPPAAAAPAGGAAPMSEPLSESGWSTAKWAGIVTAGAGVVTLAVGAGFLASALGDHADSNRPWDKNYCDADDYCGATGLALREDARAKGNVATVLGVTGAVLVGGGAALFFVGGGSGSTERGAARVGVSVAAGPGGVGLALRGSY